jgi:hypothetical protein
LHVFLSDPALKPFLSPTLTAAALVAAYAHDVCHPAVNNQFLIATSHPLALTYNDVSPLENMHAAKCFQVSCLEY